MNMFYLDFENKAHPSIFEGSKNEFKDSMTKVKNTQ